MFERLCADRFCKKIYKVDLGLRNIPDHKHCLSRRVRDNLYQIVIGLKGLFHHPGGIFIHNQPFAIRSNDVGQRQHQRCASNPVWRSLGLLKKSANRECFPWIKVYQPITKFFENRKIIMNLGRIGFTGEIRNHPL